MAKDFQKERKQQPTKVASKTSAPASIKVFSYPKKARNVYLRTGAPVRPGLVPAVAYAQVLVVPALVHVDAGAAVGGEAEPRAAVAAVGAPQVGATLLADAYNFGFFLNIYINRFFLPADPSLRFCSKLAQSLSTIFYRL